MKIQIIIILMMIFLALPIISAYDSETIIIMGGDEETLILAVGDLENSPIGRNVYTSPEVTGRTGGSYLSVVSSFDTGLICNFTRGFISENESTIEELLFKINNESKVHISQSVLDQYINNFEEKCNMTIEQEREIVKKVVFPFILIILIGLGIYSYYHRKKIKKWLIVLFDDDEDDLENEDPDLIEYVKGNWFITHSNFVSISAIV